GLERRRGRASSQDKTGGMDCRGGSSLSGNGRRERGSDYFCEKTFIIAQFALLLPTVTYLVYGAADLAVESGGVLSTRFRFMIALPLMATFFALSFRPFARRHSQAFIIAFGVVGMACTYINVYLIAVDSPFRIDNGNGTMNAMLMLGFLALLPL